MYQLFRHIQITCRKNLIISTYKTYIGIDTLQSLAERINADFDIMCYNN